ncbi:AMP-dependent synthetase/ligase [soil metagenome]
MTTTHAKGPDPVHVGPTENLTTKLWERAAASEAKEILRFPVGDGWQGLTWAQLGERVRKAGAGLIALGIEPGDRVALMSNTRMEWTISDLAILAVGAVTVPLYETSSVEQCAWVLSDSGARAAIAGTADHAKSLDAARAGAPGLGEVFVIDDGGLDALGERAGADHAEQVAARSSAVTLADLATIVYTSGTTGNPKGCMLTHGNMLWVVRQSEESLRKLLGGDDATLLFLPLAHIFARLIQFLCLEGDVPMGYARSVEKLSEDLRSFKPTFLLAVPRVFEKVFNTAQRKAEGPKRRVFDFAVATAQEWSSSPNPGLGTKVKKAIADKLVYSKLREAVGGRLHYSVSGGAPLAPHLAHFFHAAGITILEGYGLTETSAPGTVNTPDAMRIGTVGRPLPGIEIRIAEDGEILLKGGNVFKGYYHNDQATAEVLEADGWFHTGDVGEIDDGGFLRITGRKKELIVTAGGKNVAPAVLEERLKQHRLVSQAMAVGDNRPFIGCLVTLDADELAAFAKEHDLKGSTAELVRSDAVQAEVAKAVEQANAAVSKAESIRKWEILERDFTLEDNEITPTLKLRRRNVIENFGDAIERIYAR